MIFDVDEVYDKFLCVDTKVSSIDASMGSSKNYNYCPLQYWNIESLFKKYPFNPEDHIVDFGCGKGRVLIMSAYHSCKRITGYELEFSRFKTSLNNINNYTCKFGNDSKFSVYNQNVEDIVIDDTANKFFFFNPFNLEVYIKVLKEIHNSLNRNMRDILLFLYYPEKSILDYIESKELYHFVERYEYHYRSVNIQWQYNEYVVFTNKRL